MLSINCKLEEILPPKKTRNDYYVVPVLLSYKVNGKPQVRYMQCVTSQSKTDLMGLKEGMNVLVNISLKGVMKGDKCLNLDEVISISEKNG